MKWLLLPVLWLCALGIALFVLWRMARGKNVVLRGRFAPQLVRMVVIILVTLGIGIERGSAAEPARPAAGPPSAAPEETPLPAAINQATVAKWLSLQHGRSQWSRFKQELLQSEQNPSAPPSAPMIERMTADLPNKFRAIVTAELTARGSGKPAPRVRADELMAALGELEETGYYDHFLVAYLFRLTAPSLRSGVAQRQDAQPFVQLYARLIDHVKLTNTLVRAQFRIKPLMLRPRAWMSKAYNPMLESKQISFLPMPVAEMVGAAKALHATSTLGTFDKDGVALFTVAKSSGPLTVLRSGAPQPLAAGQPLRLNRLDLLETPAGGAPAVLANEWLGELRLPAGRVISIWELPRHLSPEARAKLSATIAEAMAGSEPAAERLELHLPLAQQALREALIKQPQEKGAPRLRMILALFDDSPMPQITSPVSNGYSGDDQ